MNMNCMKCKKNITLDEAAMTKKLINRGTSSYYCADCLAEAFEITPDDIWEKIRYFKETGCTLFLHSGD